MNRYTVFYEYPQRHYVKLMFEAKVTDKITELCLPVWRPGRYELQNYAKNIKDFEVYDENGNALTFKKVSKSVWHVYTIGAEFIRVTYYYYAHILDAGASFFNHSQLYINPCNCMLYISGREDDLCELRMDIPDDYEVAISLPYFEKKVYSAKDFHLLADSPFIISKDIKKSSFEFQQSQIDLWFQGDFEYDEKQMIEDVKKYTAYQTNIFGELPSRHYHYLYQMMPIKFHHGVEHMNNTVIALGPDKNFDRVEFYNEFLGISSHEFFHLWNVKRIRPEEMWPYNYKQENYSKLGWI
ncbi:MAG: M61 family peptidase, partial [Bacteroidetes bacterium]|nr:M61 family peptidase [Bacteroidota bacterium]